MKFSLFAVAALLSALVTAPASAAVVTLDHGVIYSNTYYVGGMGAGRGIGFQADQNFSTTAVAINLSVTGNANATPYKFDLFASQDGHTAGALLKSVSFNLNLGQGYQDEAFDFNFVQNSFYVLNFARVDSNALQGLGVIYSWENGSAFNYGILSVLEGFEGAFPNNGNSLIPHMRLTTGQASQVPEPGSIALMALAMFGFALTRKARR